MKIAVLAAVVAALILSLTACGAAAGTPPAGPATPSPSPSVTTTTPVSTSTTTTPTRTSSGTLTPSAPAIPSGAVALFGTISGGVKSDSLKLIGGDISWTSTHYEFLRYLPEVPALDEFGWTTSESYAKSYMWGFTQDGWVYRVRCSTDTGGKDVTRLDPKTGAVKGTFATFYTDSRYAGFAVVGDRVIYRSKTSEDLYGKRTGGGHVMALALGGGETRLLDYSDPSNAGDYYSVGPDLLTIVRSYESGTYYYDIYLVDPATLALGDLLYTYGSDDYVDFFAGETALYWGQQDDAAGVVRVVRFPLDVEPTYFVTITEDDPSLVSVDESRGTVLIVSTDSSPESPHFTAVDLATRDITELDVDPGFFSTLIYGTGQFMLLD